MSIMKWIPTKYDWLMPILVFLIVASETNRAARLNIDTWADRAIFWMVGGLCILWACGLWTNGLEIQIRETRRLQDIDVEQEKRDGFKPVVTPLPNLNPESTVYNQDTEQVQLVGMNRERHVARTLIAQHKSGLRVNLTEEFWVKSGRYRAAPYKFRQMLYDWEHEKHCIARKGRNENSTYKVTDWKKMERIGRGERV